MARPTLRLSTPTLQAVVLQHTGSAFKPKECRFKVQQQVHAPATGSGAQKQKPPQFKTIGKTPFMDLGEYCSDSGMPAEETVTLPLT